jgi:hypothetical protein
VFLPCEERRKIIEWSVNPIERKKKYIYIFVWEIEQGKRETKREKMDFCLGGSTRNNTT